ncbi:hypothetical protein SDJN02_10030, partial [Cucurbita argyrosperma subsp. argyrosperma]
MESGMVISEAITEVKNAIRNEDEKLLIVVPDGEVKEIAVLTEFKKKKKKKKKNQIQVSNVKKPFYYYNLSKRYEVELSALGMATPTVVMISEILKKNGLTLEKNLTISSVSLKNGENERLVMKPKIEISLVNTEKIKNITTATSEDC